MTTPIIPTRSTTLTAALAAFASGAYSATALRVQQSAVSVPGALLGDFRLTDGVWGGTPAAGSCLQLFAIDRDFAGNAGPVPSATNVPRLCGVFSPQELSSTFGVMAVNGVSLSFDADYYVYNSATGQTFAGTLSCSPWSPGT